jgi:hypothetical protein
MSDFDKTLDASDPNDVTRTSVKPDGTLTADPLEVAVNGPGDANRLLIFSGIAVAKIDFAEDDEILRQGPVHVKLNYRLPKSVKFISSSTTASLGSIFNTTGEAFTFAVVDAATEPQLVDPVNPQSELELVLTSNLAVQGHATGVSSMAYQANVLVRDTNPDLESILVTTHGPGSAGFSPHTAVLGGQAWDFQINFTGPIVNDFEAVVVSSSNPSRIPMGSGPGLADFVLVELSKPLQSASFAAAPTIPGPAAQATITASFTRRDGTVVSKTATVGTTELN